MHLRYIVWKTNWDTEKDAAEFVTLYTQCLKTRFANSDLSALQTGWAKAENGYEFKLIQSGQLVTLGVKRAINS